MMNKAILLANRKRHKELIKQFGDVWEVLKKDFPQCFSGEEGFFIAPLGVDETTRKNSSRWVKREDLIFPES